MENSTSSLDRLFIPDSKPFDDDASTKVGEESDNEVNVEHADRELRFVFEDKLRDNAKMRSHCHSKVAVLLIDWEKKSEGYLDTNSEVNRLQNLFKKKYFFTTRRRRLNTDLPQTVQKQMQKFLVDFTYEFDTNETLLIIYYAGHGLAAAPGTLTLHGTTTKPEPYKKHLNHIVWNQAEESIKDTKGDKLLIFDCCYAGELARKKKRGPGLGKIFDFLGATQHNEPAAGPGDDSFTSALIWALNDYATCTDGFFLQELQQRLKEAPGFQHNQQTPCIGDRGAEPALRRLKMCPLPKNAEAIQRHQDDVAQHQSARPKFYLALELLFSTCPKLEEIEFLGKSMQDIISYKEYPLQHVLWRGLSPRQKWKMKWKEAVHQALSHHRKETMSSPSAQSLQGTGSLFPPAIVESPATIFVSPIDETQGSCETSATSLSVHKEPAVPEVFEVAGERQSYFYATMFIQKKSWFFLCLGICIGFALCYMLFVVYPPLLPFWPTSGHKFWRVLLRSSTGHAYEDEQG